MVESLTVEQITDLRQAFSLYVKDGSYRGTVMTKDLGAVIYEYGLKPTEAQLQDMIEEIGRDTFYFP